MNKPINNLKIRISKLKDIDLLTKMLASKGNVSIIFEIEENNKKYTFKLKNKRMVDQNTLNTIKKQGIFASIF